MFFSVLEIHLTMFIKCSKCMDRREGARGSPRSFQKTEPITSIVPEVLRASLYVSEVRVYDMSICFFDITINYLSEVSSLDSSWIRRTSLLFLQLVHLITHRLIAGISNRPADSRKEKPGNHVTVAE